MPLLSQAVNVLPALLVPNSPGSIAVGSIPTRGTPGALGDTMHGVLNGINIFPKTALFDTATLGGELTWMQWLRVTQNEAVFKGRSNYLNAIDGTEPVDKVTKNFFGLAMNFTPTWFQVFPGVDLSMPLTWSGGLSGNAAVLLGGNKNAGNYSAGVGADIYQKYRIDLKYSGYYGQYATTRAGMVGFPDVLPNGSLAALSDRGWVSLTFKTTF
jgi:hypothetical protein